MRKKEEGGTRGRVSLVMGWRGDGRLTASRAEEAAVFCFFLLLLDLTGVVAAGVLSESESLLLSLLLLLLESKTG